MKKSIVRDKGLEILKAVLPELIISNGVSVTGMKDINESRAICKMIRYRVRQLGYKTTARCYPKSFMMKVERDFRYEGDCTVSMLTESDRRILERQDQSFASNREAMDLELIKSVAEARKDGIATLLVPEGRKVGGYKASIEAALKRLGYDDIMVLHGKDRLCLITVETE